MPNFDFCPVCNGHDFIIKDGEEFPCPNPECYQGLIEIKNEK